ncbi:MAG TPA: hypothetical protein VG013_02470 [Gemmataceae bacterium]|nr:hypothetical protein [Gemmataceae bacterium]
MENREHLQRHGFWAYLRDRLRGLGQVPRLAELIRQRAAAGTTARLGEAVPT